MKDGFTWQLLLTYSPDGWWVGPSHNISPECLRGSFGTADPSQVGLIFHSDRGSQYASADCQTALLNAEITPSMSRRANCWDNAVAESFFGSLKTELIYPRIFSTRVMARTMITEWIEVFYNRQRIHSTIGYLAPVQFEENYWSNLEQPMEA